VKVRLKIIGSLRGLGRDEVGGTLAELAIVVPFLVVMVAAVSELGRFCQTYTTLSQATRASARYLSNRKRPITGADTDAAANLVVCGKMTCAGGDELVKGMTPAKVCIDDKPEIEAVRVSIPSAAKTCTNGNTVPHDYQPIFNIGALLNNDTFTLVLPISPGTTMYYINELE
jgi:Flp pilus assembly protein TadG